MSKKNIILGGSLILLIILAYVYQGPFQEWQSSLGKPKNFLSKINFSVISKMDVTKNGKTFTIEKNGDKWKITGTKDFYVQDDSIKKLSESINNISKEELRLVSNSKDKKKDFQTDSQGTAVKLYKKEGLIADFILGKLSDDGNYIVAINSDKTYVVKTDLKSILNDSDSWYDKTIFSGKKEDINRLRLQFSDSEFTVEKNKNNKWDGILPYKFSVNEKKLDSVLDIMSSLVAVGVPEQNYKNTGLEKSQLIVQASGISLNNTLMIGGPSKDGNYYAKKGDSDNIYLISKIQRDSLMKKMKDLK